MRTPIVSLRKLLPSASMLALLLLLAGTSAAAPPDEERYTELQRFLRMWRAAHTNDPAAAEAALDAGVKPDDRSPHGGYIRPGLTCLQFAVNFDAPAVAEVLLARGADVEATDDRGWTAMHYIAERLLHAPTLEHREKVVRFLDLLLRHKADINREDNAGRTPLHHASMHYADSTATVDLLLARAATFDLYTAAAIGNVARVTALLEMTPDLARRPLKGGATPLHFAASMGRRQIAQLLLDAGANTEARDEEGQTALHRASFGFHTGQPEVVELLLTKTRAVNVRDNRGRTPLHYASHYWASHTTIPEQLLANGALVNARDDQGLSPLHFAAYQSGRKEMCALLLSHGADLHAKTDAGYTVEALVRMHAEHRELNVYFDELMKKEGAKGP